uniref:Uncharacterized protein n=1 Tax=Caenorhabditis japonica TaxID=281687 RepID=A0A8R1ENX9_CAEJA
MRPTDRAKRDTSGIHPINVFNTTVPRFPLLFAPHPADDTRLVFLSGALLLSPRYFGSHAVLILAKDPTRDRSITLNFFCLCICISLLGGGGID